MNEPGACGKCGKREATLMTASVPPYVQISCQEKGCGRLVTGESMSDAWKRFEQVEQPPLPPPTVQDARSIPCDEEFPSHRWGRTLHTSGARCLNCGLEARDE